jgi:nitrous oxidase accessory protein
MMPVTQLTLALLAAMLTQIARADTPQAHASAEIEALIEAAEPGETILLPAGVYMGNVRVTKSVTIDARGAGVIDGGGEGTVVEIDAPGVTLRNLVIRGSGSNVSGEPAAIRVLAPDAVIEDNHIEDALFGIDLREAPGAIIRRNVIRGKDLEPGRRGDGIRLWWSHACVVEDNDVQGTRDMVFWYSEGLKIARNRVSDSRYGLHFMYSHDTVLTENDLESNSVGVYLMYSNRIRLIRNTMTNNRGASGYGIGLKDCDDIVVEGNALLANRVGAYLDNSPSSVDSTGIIEGNLIAFNEIGLVATPNTHDNVLTGNAFVENEEQAGVHGRGDLSHNVFSRDGVGNFWSDYAGFDLDGDAIGDLPYEPRSLFGSMLAHEPNLRLFVHSPAQQAVEFTARALPEFRPAPTLTDPAPLARPPSLVVRTAERPSAPWPMATLGTALLSGVGAMLWVAARSVRMPVPGSRSAQP